MTENMENQDKEDNVIFVGAKPLMSYVSGVVMQFTSKNAPEVIVKSRGRFISKAVDVAEVARNRFLKEHDIQTKHIKIGSEEFETKEGKKVNVSIMEITLAKNI